MKCILCLGFLTATFSTACTGETMGAAETKVGESIQLPNRVSWACYRRPDGRPVWVVFQTRVEGTPQFVKISDRDNRDTVVPLNDQARSSGFTLVTLQGDEDCATLEVTL